MVKAIDLLEINERLLKSLSNVGVNIGDYRHVEMYNEYIGMERKGIKKEYIKSFLAEKYGMSESSVYRTVKRLGKQVKI